MNPCGTHLDVPLKNSSVQTTSSNDLWQKLHNENPIWTVKLALQQEAPCSVVNITANHKDL